MEKFKKTEIIILAILWAMSLSTYSIALLNDYDLFYSDFLGLVGLTTVTLITYFYSKISFQSVLILLLLGLFNLLSFAYFFNFVMTFNFSKSVTPEIQLISLVLLTFLVVKKRKEVSRLYRDTFLQTEEDKEKAKQRAQNRFKTKFEQLSDREIETKLKQDLVPEAISALNEIKKERNIA